MALGNSISAGYGAMPATQGFVYQLYQSGAIDKVNNTLFCAAGIPGALSTDVLDYQVPQVGRFFANTGMPYRKVVTLTLGGKDLLQVLDGVAANDVMANVSNNLFQILTELTTKFPDARIYVANYYDPRLPIPGGDLLVAGLNQVIGGVVALFPGKAVLVDIHSAFDGRSGLLLIEKKGSNALEVHPTNAGYRVITQAFEDAIGGH
jgi:lysophospholipase L1-like esterase